MSSQQELPPAVMEFLKGYYASSPHNRQNLAMIYRENSLLHWEDKLYQGPQDIMEKLLSVGYIEMEGKTLEVQPSGNGGVLILVTGIFRLDPSGPPLSFMQVFQLVPDGGSFYVLNEFFRNVYPAEDLTFSGSKK